MAKKVLDLQIQIFGIYMHVGLPYRDFLIYSVPSYLTQRECYTLSVLDVDLVVGSSVATKSIYLGWVEMIM